MCSIWILSVAWQYIILIDSNIKSMELKSNENVDKQLTFSIFCQEADARTNMPRPQIFTSSRYVFLRQTTISTKRN